MRISKEGSFKKYTTCKMVFFQELSCTPMSHFVIFPQPNSLLFHSLKNDTEQKNFLYIKLLKHYNIKGSKKVRNYSFNLCEHSFLHTDNTRIY